jgi:UDP-2,3-diacylglucosamine pyrophosphatase LpxH
MSDLHYDGRNVDLLELVLEQMVELGPKYILITGDLVEGPGDDLGRPVAMIREAISELEKIIGQKPILRVVPGNHDFFFLGAYGVRRTRDFMAEFSKQEMGNYFSADDRIAIATFDSNRILEPRGGLWRRFVQLLRPMTHGLIIERDLDDFSDWTRRLGRSKGKEDFTSSLKIALVHHHPMPTSYNFLPKLADEAYMMLENAGVFMYRLVQEEFDLILHGHRHVPQFCRAIYYDEEYIEREITVLGCGSSAKSTDDKIRAVGRNFNVIKVKGNGEVIATQYFKRGTGSFIPNERVIKIRGPRKGKTKKKK